jgi:two-component system sensor histidine kinase/response regulator
VLNDILDFSKIEAGRLTLEHIDFDLRRTLENNGQGPFRRGRGQGAVLALSIAPDVPVFHARRPHAPAGRCSSTWPETP